MKRPINGGTPPMESAYASPAAVAAALGVSVTTVKRWVDDDVLPAHKTAGGHRKLLIADVARFARESNLPQVDMSLLTPWAAALPHQNVNALRKEFDHAVHVQDTASLRRIILDAFRAGVPMEVLSDEMIAPGLHHLGHLWEQGRADIMHEHRVSQACVAALHEIITSLRVHADRDRPLALGAAPEDDHSSLTGLLAEAVLLSCGWTVTNLGPHTPMSAIRAGLARLKPKLIWVSVSYLSKPQEFQREYLLLFNDAKARGVPVAIGGRGLDDGLRSQLPYTTFGDGFAHLAAFAKTLHQKPQRPKRGRPAHS